MPKTIRELADELNVSKQTIQYHYQRLPAKNRQKDIQGTNMISITAERIIRNKVAKPLVAKNKQTDSKENNELVATLRREVEDLKSQRDKQLATKDRQIENLTKILDQSQQLQLINEKEIEKFKTLSSKIDSANSNNAQKKYVWWRFWK